MLFFALRLILSVILCISAYFLIKNSRFSSKGRLLIIALTLIITLTTISVFIPIENTFITFSTPESAFHYTNSGEVQLIVEGKESDLVIGDKNDTDILLIIPKTDNGWKLGLGVHTKKVIRTIESEITIYVYQYKNTDDYYIMVLDTNGGECQISDTNNSKFYSLRKENSALNKNFYTYYAYIGNFRDRYTVTVNGNQIIIDN